MEENDYQRFVTLLFLANSEERAHLSNVGYRFRSFLELSRMLKDRKTLVSIGAYCLMPNHFHLLVKEKTDGGISKFMKKLLTGYAMYFNKKYTHSGVLFQGRFKSSHVGEDEYLKYLFAYIHLNPVKLIDPNWKENSIIDRTQAKVFLSQYRFSSMEDYLGDGRDQEIILEKQAFPDYFSEKNSFEKFVDLWLAYPSSRTVLDIKDRP